MIAAIAWSHAESLRCYVQVSDERRVAARILEAVGDMLGCQPWYYRRPMEVCAWCLGLLCLFATGRRLSSLPPPRRAAFVRACRRLPGFGLLDTFAQSIALLNLFDDDALKAALPDRPHDGRLVMHA